MSRFENRSYNTAEGLVVLALCLACSFISLPAQAQIPRAPQPLGATAGTLVIVPAEGEVSHANDEALLTWTVEEQDRDKAAAASRVNQKMKQGIETIRKSDARAELKTFNYYTYPVYPDDQPQPRQGNKPRTPAAWRVGQSLEMKTTDLEQLPATVAAGQRLLGLTGLQFGLSDKTAKMLDSRRIEAAYVNLSERISSIARAMGRSAGDAVIDTVDFEGSGAYTPQSEMMAKSIRAAPAGQDAASVEEPNFEPGETTLQMRVVGKVRFK